MVGVILVPVGLGHIFSKDDNDDDNEEDGVVKEFKEFDLLFGQVNADYSGDGPGPGGDGDGPGPGDGGTGNGGDACCGDDDSGE